MVGDLEWKAFGHRTSVKIERSKVRRPRDARLLSADLQDKAQIAGRCGGWCGECAPDKFKGIVFELAPSALYGG